MMMRRGWGGIAVVICLEMYERHDIAEPRRNTVRLHNTLDVALNLIYRHFRRSART